MNFAGGTYGSSSSSTGSLVVSNGAAVPGHMASFANSSGTLIGDSGLAVSEVFLTDGSRAMTGTLDTALNEIRSANIRPRDDDAYELGSSTKRYKTLHVGDINGTNVADFVSGPASSTAGTIPAYADTTGKLLASSAVPVASVVQGPASATNASIAVFNGTSGKLLANSAVALANVVQGPASATANTLAVYSDTTGKLLASSAVPVANVVQGPASATANTLAVYSDTSGKQLVASSVPVASVVQGPASATNANIAVFNGTTGKLLANSAVALANVAQGPASSVSGNLASYSSTTGKALADSGVAAANVVQCTLGTTPGEIAVFTSGKNIATAGILGTDLLTVNGGSLVGTLYSENNNLWALNQPCVLSKFVSNGQVSVVNTATATSLFSASSVGTNIYAANTTQIGMMIRARCWAFINNWTTGNLFLSLRVNITDVATVQLNVPQSGYITIDFDSVLRDTGVIRSSGKVSLAAANGISSGETAWNATVANTIGIMARWQTASASNSLTSISGSLETVYVE